MAHPNARLTPHGRRLLADRVRAGWTITAAARAAGISRQTGSKWWHRAQMGCLADRTSTVHQQARRHPAELVEQLCARGASSGSAHTSWHGRAGLPARVSTRSSGGKASAGSTGLNRGHLSCGTSAIGRASSSTSIRRCSAGSAGRRSPDPRR